MTTDLARLKPSTQEPISIQVLRELPLGGVYHYSSAGFEATMKVDRFSGGLPRCSTWDPVAKAWEPSGEARVGRFCYPELPAMLFKLTADRMSGKTVTRRKKAPPWCKPGRLFMGWDRSFRSGKGKARGLGVFRVVSVETSGRWRCEDCGSRSVSRAQLRSEEAGEFMCQCHECGSSRAAYRFSTLTPSELAAEGFPELTADEFWGKLKKARNVAADGTSARIEFERV